MSTIFELPAEIRKMIIEKLSIPDQREAIYSGVCEATGSQEVILGERNRVSVKDLMRVKSQIYTQKWHNLSSKFQFKHIEVVFSASSIEWIKSAACLPEWVRQDPIRIVEEFMQFRFPIDKIIFDESVKSAPLYDIDDRIEEVVLLGSGVRLTNNMSVPRIKIPATSFADYRDLDRFDDLRVIATDNISPVIGPIGRECVFEATNPHIIYLDSGVDFEPTLSLRVIITKAETSPVIVVHKSFEKLVVTFETSESVTPIIHIMDNVDTLVVESSHNIPVSVRCTAEVWEMVFTNCTGEFSDGTETGPDDDNVVVAGSEPETRAMIRCAPGGVDENDYVPGFWGYVAGDYEL